MKPAKFTISVVTYLAVEEAYACISSICKNSGSDLAMILTANGNPKAEDMFQAIRKVNPGIVRVVVNKRNEGFIKPSNNALAMTNTPFFVLLNDDTIVPENWLEKLAEPLESNPMAALSGPSGTCRSLTRNLDGYKGRKLEYIEGSCLMAKTEIVKQHGLFPDWLDFAYSEDVELSLRLRSLGYTIHQAPFTIVHKRQTTSRQIPGIWEIRKKNNAAVLKRYATYFKKGQL